MEISLCLKSMYSKLFVFSETKEICSSATLIPQEVDFIVMHMELKKLSRAELVEKQALSFREFVGWLKH